MHDYIDCLPDNKLEALRPILSLLANDPLVIETDLTDEERQIITDGMKEYEKGGFIPLEDIVPRPERN